MFLLYNELSGAHGAIELAFGFPVKGEEAEPPLAFNVGGLDHASAEGASAWSWLPGQHPLILIAHEHQTHLVTSFRFLLFFGF